MLPSGAIVEAPVRAYNGLMVQQFRVICCVLGVALLSMAFATSGADIVVSTDGVGAFRSIQRAIDAAAYGDVILVNPGIYEESIVLISGITIRGAGASHTVIRSSYGYQPVIQGISVGAVALEGLSLERGTSILEATVVDLQSSQVTFLNCRVAGGQNGGVISSGVSTLAFQTCVIEDNHGYGLQISGPTDITLKNCRIADNGSIGLYLRDASAVIQTTTFQWNEWDGILLEGASILDCVDSTVSDNGRWGLRVLDTSQARIVGSAFNTQATGNISVRDGAALTLASCVLRGGLSSSLQGNGTADVQISDTQILDAVGDGLTLQDQASLELQLSIIAHCGGNGLSLRTDGVCQVLRVTSAYNGGHGLEFRGLSLQATHNILALNDGIGLSVSRSTGAGQVLELDYNNVWGNRAGDYAGTYRSSSDVSAAPDFVNPASDDFSLNLSSPCIDGGEFGTMIGASSNPLWDGLSQLEMGIARTEAEWGSLLARLSWTPSSIHSIDGLVSWEFDWGAGRAEATTMLSGWDRFTANGALQFAPFDSLAILGGRFTTVAGVRGVWDGEASRWEGWGNVALVGPSTSIEIQAAYEGPLGLSRQEFQVSLGGFSLTGHATDLTLMTLDVGWSTKPMPEPWSSLFDVTVRLVPDLQAAVTSQWQLGNGSLQLSARAYLTQLTTAAFLLSWRDDASTRVSVNVRLRSGQFEDAEIGLSLRLADFKIGASMGANSTTGPRCRLAVLVNTSRWFVPQLNHPPVPAFSTSPHEPEAGEVVTFDASDSYDPDGDLDQIWWDFGDGETAIGLVVHHRFLEPGDYSIALTISDLDGDVTTLEERFAVAASRTTPVAAFTWMPVSEGGTRLQRALRAGDFILLDAAESWDPNDEIAEYSWDLQSDGVFDRTSADPRLVIDPLTAGTWPMTLRVVDSEGHSDAIMHVLYIEKLKPPIADFQLSPSTPAVGDPIRFIDASSSQDGALLSWEWDFGNGHTSRDREPTHRYQEPGDFDVQLTVRDSEGLVSTKHRTVSVQVNPELVPIQQTWALLIGITDYAEVEDLSFARRDAEAMAAWLLHANVPADHIRLLTDGAATSPNDEIEELDAGLATLVNVREGLGWLRQMAGRDDLVIIHFSGHGYQGADDGFDERDGVDEFFVLQDTRAAAKDDTALRDDEFGRFLDRIVSEHVLVFFDSCYSGGLSRSLVPGSRATGGVVDVFSDFKLEGRLILAASGENQDAFESPQLKHGVLTHFLLNGLGGAADLNADEHVTVWELFEYVHSEVPAFVQQERGELQIPQLIGEGESRVVLTRAPAAPAFSYCPAIPFAGAATWFRTEAGSDQDGSTVTWDFGDGTSMAAPDVVHRYEHPGSYTVTLSIRDTDDSELATSQAIVIADWATVVELDEDNGLVLVSAGRQHGIGLSDRFALADGPGASAEILEVVELIDENVAACRVIDLQTTPAVGSRLRLPDDGPCWPPR